MKRSIDINCDLGEHDENSSSSEIALMKFISSCNIACGFHAGGPSTIWDTMLEAIENGVAIGAHPSFWDRKNFGREFIRLSEKELRACLLYQLSAMKGIARAMGAELHHVKAHGALYHYVSQDENAASAMVETVAQLDENLKIYGLPQSALEFMARQIGLDFRREAFLDRRYEDDLTLRSRTNKDAVITSLDEVKLQAHHLLSGFVITHSGKKQPLSFDTLCLHSDTPGARGLAGSVHQFLKEHGVEITSV